MIRLALIGAGGMGTGDVEDALRSGEAILTAVADIYQGRLDRAKERWGSQVYTSRDYREVLARKDVDAVIVATPDHWHAAIAEAALRAGKDVYVEKPMVHKFAEGPKLITAQKETGRILQVGSQYASSLVFAKAGELLQLKALPKQPLQMHL